MRKEFVAVVLSASLSVPAVADTAQPIPSASAGYGEPASYWISAPVVDVNPVVSQRTVRHPVRQCTTTGYRQDDYERRPDSGSYFLPGLFGGLVGGLIGNQFGGGNGRKALTIAGALAGSSIARDAARQRDHRSSYPTEVCRTTYESEVRNDVTAYDVTYEYAGRQFSKRMSSDPGDTVRVRVALAPASDGG